MEQPAMVAVEAGDGDALARVEPLQKKLMANVVPPRPSRGAKADLHI